nr:sigma factor [Tumebacillus amylolyticus]
MARLLVDLEPFVFRLSFHLTLHQHDAEDLAQEVLAKICVRLTSFRGDSTLQTWVYTMVVNTHRDPLRKKKLRQAEALKADIPSTSWEDAADARLGGIRALEEAPLSTRPLQPSKALIRSTVRKNRLRRTLRSSSVAVGITILLGAGVGYGLHRADMGAFLRTGGGECKCAAPLQEMGSTWVDVQLKTPETQAIAKFLTETLNREEVRRVTIVDFQQDGTYSEDIVGTATLDVDLQPGVATNYTQGRQEAVVELSHVDGGFGVVYDRNEFSLKQTVPDGLLSLWVQALQKRNGVEEFRLFSPALKKRVRSLYREAGWSIGVSKPNPSGFKILHISHTNDSESVYDLELTMPGSDPSTATLTLRKYATGWLIDHVVYQGGSLANEK